MKIDKSFKISVTSSIIASLIVMIFLQPLLKLAWDSIVGISNFFYIGFSNSLYKSAALGHRNWIDFIVYSFLHIFFLGFMIIIYLKAKFAWKFEQYESKLDELKDNQAEREKFIELEKNKNIKWYKFSLTFLRIYDKIGWLVIILMFILISVSVFNAFTDLQLNTSFSQRIDTIAPYTTEKEIKTLKSKWATMKTRKDFMKINDTIEKIAKENKIELPSNLLN